MTVPIEALEIEKNAHDTDADMDRP